MVLVVLGQVSVEDLDVELECDYIKIGVVYYMVVFIVCFDDVVKQEVYCCLCILGELFNEYCLVFIEGLCILLGVQMFVNFNGFYFDDFEQIWQEFLIEMVQCLVVGLFFDGDIVEIVDCWLVSY